MLLLAWPGSQARSLFLRRLTSALFKSQGISTAQQRGVRSVLVRQRQKMSTTTIYKFIRYSAVFSFLYTPSLFTSPSCLISFSGSPRAYKIKSSSLEWLIKPSMLRPWLPAQITAYHSLLCFLHRHHYTQIQTGLCSSPKAWARIVPNSSHHSQRQVNSPT